MKIMQMFCTAGIFLWIFVFAGPYPGSAPDQRAVNLIIVIHDRAGGSCYWVLHCTPLTTMHCLLTTMHCLSLQCTALPCITLHCTPLHCTVRRCWGCYLHLHPHVYIVVKHAIQPPAHCTLCCVQSALCTVLCTEQIVQCSVYRVHCAV